MPTRNCKRVSKKSSSASNEVTDFNKYNPYPSIFDIRCPKCAGKAEFRFAFALLSQKEYDRMKPKLWPCAETTSWGNWIVVQHEPAMFRWKPPARGYRRSDHGIRSCSSCIGRFKHHLHWPRDAYYRFDLREGLLWAWSESHVHSLIDFIESKDRDPAKHGNYLFLRHIPKEFLDGRRRHRVVRDLKKGLAQLHQA